MGGGGYRGMLAELGSEFIGLSISRPVSSSLRLLSSIHITMLYLITFALCSIDFIYLDFDVI